MDSIELLATVDHYILQCGDKSLWCSRHSDGQLMPRIGAELPAEGIVCMGLVYGLVGKFQADRLILIRQRQLVGQIPGYRNTMDDVYKIQKISILNLNGNCDNYDLDPCKIHVVADPDGSNGEQGPGSAGKAKRGSSIGSASVQKTWNVVKSATQHVKPRTANRHDIDLKEKFDRRIVDEIGKMFNDTESFYYSHTGDLTNSVQRKNLITDVNEPSGPVWKRVDDRFFWNKYMVSSLIDLETDLADFWITPVIQGYVDVEKCHVDPCGLFDFEIKAIAESEPIDFSQNHEYTMIIISRRSRFRSGTRYKRRGVDDMGKCANYVETEQIFTYGSHCVSFVQVRGSVPVYWSQPGYKYRPPPQLDRNDDEAHLSYAKHFEEELDLYKNIVIVNLVEQAGKEKIIGDSYMNHVLRYDSSAVTYVTFDFHEYCRGMKFENVSILIENLKDVIRDARYTWVDKEGMICDQISTFRVNCIDCLDRTNVVQTAIARCVMDFQFSRLGFLAPEVQLPLNCRRVFQKMWANNGDIISRQYAGTAALKSDYTRTGERRFAGMMKDSYNSASRYYLNRFKDAYRQAAIDLMHGNPVSEDLSSPESDVADDNCNSVLDHEHHERVKFVIEDCKKILIPETEIILGGWPLIDADPVTGTAHQRDQDMDTVLVLTKDCYYVAEYDDQTDRITRYQKVLLEDLEKIELGPEPNQIFSIRSKQSYCVRFHYLVSGQSGYFHMFRSTNTRFFNNMAIPIRTPEESVESLKAICESFKVALSVRLINVPYFEGRLERRKSKMPSFGESSRQRGLRKDMTNKSVEQLPRNTSDGQLLNLKSVGSRALYNVSSQFSRFKGRFTGYNARHQPVSINEPAHSTRSLCSSGVTFNMESSGDEDSDEDSVIKIRKGRQRDQPSVASTSSVFFTERTLSSDYSECSDFDDPVMTPTAEPRQSTATEAADLANDALLESCGILATSPPLTHEYSIAAGRGRVMTRKRRSLFENVDDFVLDAMNRASLRQLHRKASESITSIPSPPAKLLYGSVPSMPAIQITNSAAKDENSELPFLLEGKSRNISKSSEHVDANRLPGIESVSNSASFSTMSASKYDPPYDVGNSFGANVISRIKPSHSENAIQDFSSLLSLNLTNPLSSPIVIKKDLVLSPLSRIAKGVQNFGMNLRSGQNVAARRTNLTQVDSASYEKLKQRKEACKSKFLEL